MVKLGRVLTLTILLALVLVLRTAEDGQAGADTGVWQEGVAAVEPAAPSEVTAAVDCTDTGCPTAPSGLDKCVERTKFCVYYTTASISETEAEWAADVVEMYWNRFTSLGFQEPKYSGKLEVHLSDITGDCNGGTGYSSNAMSTYAGCFTSDIVAQSTLGHELTHRVQYAHDDDDAPSAAIQTKLLKEGTARATEDNWFENVDHRTDALTAGFSFNKELNAYLIATNNDITSYAMRYKSCLWWKYGMEQYGTFTESAEGGAALGIDFVRAVYERNEIGQSGIAAVNGGLADLGAGTTFNEAFKQFAVANWTKDLAGLPSDAYDYLDEDEALSPAAYGPLAPTSGGTINTSSSASWANQNLARYGIRYYQADVGSPCPVISASFHRDDAGPAFYHVITQNGSAFNTHVHGSGEDWTQAFLNDGVTKVVAIAGSLGNSSQVDVSLECANPVLEIKMPNADAVVRVQPGDKFLVQVLVTDGSGGPVVGGLSYTDFAATVDGTSATVVGGGFIQEQYWLLVQAPDLPDATYDLTVDLASLASDDSLNSVVYTPNLIDQVLVIDRSGSMGIDDRLEAAKDAASFYVDVTRIGDGLGVVPYTTDVAPTPWGMNEILAQSDRDNAQSFINGLFPGNLTSIGDGLAEAVKLRAESPTDNAACSFVLLSDGMENEPEYWSAVQTDVINSGCPVTSIAFGPESNETLMQDIAMATGGLYFYNDVYVSSPRVSDASTSAITPQEADLALANTYEYAQATGAGLQRLLAEGSTLTRENTQAQHLVLIDDSLTEVVFSLDWYAAFDNLDLWLVDPMGKIYDGSDPGYTFEDLVNKHRGFRVPNPEPGLWQIHAKWSVLGQDAFIPYQVIVSGRTLITLDLLLPDRLGIPADIPYSTGTPVPIYALLTYKSPISATVEAHVTAPNGTQSTVFLADDGQHGDGMPRDGLYAGLYTLVTQALYAEPSGEDKEPPEPVQSEGGYRVLARAIHPKFQREALGSFAVPEGVDADQDRLPDIWEKLNQVDNPDGDPDGDGLNNYGEYINGTDPHDPDTDDGGEKDGSEVAYERNPLDPSDDGIRAPDFFQVRPVLARPPTGGEIGPAVQLLFDWKPAYSGVWLYRAESASGPWSGMFLGPQPGGVFTDTQVVAGDSYWYRLEAIGGAVRQIPVTSAVLTSEEVIPSEDPLLPEAEVIIDGGALSTRSRDVVLTFAPYESEGEDPLEAFDDITEMKISNLPSMAGAVWQPFEQGVPWEVDAMPGEVARVYVLFRDAALNESLSPEIGMILYDPYALYLPVVLKMP